MIFLKEVIPTLENLLKQLDNRYLINKGDVFLELNSNPYDTLKYKNSVLLEKIGITLRENLDKELLIVNTPININSDAETVISINELSFKVSLTLKPNKKGDNSSSIKKTTVIKSLKTLSSYSLKSTFSHTPNYYKENKSSGIIGSYIKEVQNYQKKFIKNESGKLRSLIDNRILFLTEIFSKSLLKGEFISDFDLVEKELENIKDFFKSKKYSLYIQSINVDLVKYLYFLKDVLDYYSDVYLSFLKKIEGDFFDKSERDLIFIDKTIPKFESAFYAGELVPIETFKNVYRISLYDIYLYSDFNQLIKLIELEKSLILLKGHTYDLAKEKLSFIIYKWISRKETIYNNEYINFSHNGISLNVNERDFKILDIENWKEKIKSHYEISTNYEQIIKSNIKRINYSHNIDYSNIDYFDLHYLIKYFKDILKNKEELKKILDYIVKLNDSDKLLKFDKYSFNILKNYIINNYFSSICDTEENLEEVTNQYHLCNTLLSEKVDNFFLDFKYLNFVTDKVSKDLANINKESILDKLHYYDSLINNNCIGIIEKYENKKEWAKSNSNFIFLLPFKESFLKTKNKIKNDKELDEIFIFSSFVLPIDIRKVESDFNKTRQSLNEAIGNLGVIKTLKVDLNKLIDLDKEFDRKDLKSIEIIGLFTAIITFILSAIPAFKFVNTLNDALLFTMSMASSLGLFMTLVFISTRGIKSFRRNWLIVLGFLFFALVGLYLYEKAEQKSINNLIDNSVENKLKIESSDSIRKVIIENFIKDYEVDKNSNKESKQ